MFIYLSTYLCMHIYVSSRICYMYIDMNMYLYMSTYIFTYMYSYLYTSINIYICTSSEISRLWIYLF